MSQPLILDERTLQSIKEIALRLFHDRRIFEDRDALLYEALATYMTSKGLTPGFEVKKK